MQLQHCEIRPSTGDTKARKFACNKCQFPTDTALSLSDVIKLKDFCCRTMQVHVLLVVSNSCDILQAHPPSFESSNLAAQASNSHQHHMRPCVGLVNLSFGSSCSHCRSLSWPHPAHYAAVPGDVERCTSCEKVQSCAPQTLNVSAG